MKRRAGDFLKIIREFANGGLLRRCGVGLPNDDNARFRAAGENHIRFSRFQAGEEKAKSAANRLRAGFILNFWQLPRFAARTVK